METTALPTVCWDCGATGTLAEGTRCDCGESRWLATDATGFAWPRGEREVGAGRDGDLPVFPTGMWRYADLLPVDRPGGVGGGAGGTPLVRADRLDEYAGCRLLVKDEGENPTGSFKDRGSAVGVARADTTGRRWVGTVSHGNMATSVAAHAAGHGLDCVVLVPADIAGERLAAIARYEPTVLRVDGDYGRLYEETLAVGPAAGIEFVNSDVALRVAGQKTVALEILETFVRGGADDAATPVGPDAIVLSTSSGGLASATWKAVLELAEAGLLDDPPRLYLVQSAACDPIARAFRTGAERVERVANPGETVAYSIANPDPPSGNRALAAARATGGAVLSVPDDDILDAQRRLASQAGLCVETASAVPLAGLRRLTGDSEVEPDETAVVVATGSGFKEPWEGDEAAAGRAAARTVHLADVPGVLEQMGG